MVGDLRRTFIGWLKKTESDLGAAQHDLKRERQAFEEEKTRVWKQFMAEKQKEYEKIREDRKKADVEMQNALKQVQIEREDARSKMNDERMKLEQEKEQFRRKMRLEKEKFTREYEAFEQERRQIVEHNTATETMVDLNVGGITFETARQTLVQQPGSTLEAIVSGRHRVSRDRHGRVFIDRDAELFRSVLNFLRNPTVPPMPRDPAESEALVKEAEFYGVKFFPFPLVFACGGHNGYEHLRAMEVLDVGNQCWRPCRSMNTERTYFGAAEMNSRLFLFGGQNLDYKALCETEVYDCLRDQWMQGPALNIARRNCCGAAPDGRVFAAGGFDGQNIVNSVEAYDPRMKNWMTVAPLLTPRSAGSCVALGDRLWVMGGSSGNRLRTVEFYEPRLNKWEPFHVDMIETRSAGCAVGCLQQLFSLGGIDNSQNIHYSMECLDSETAQWSFRKNMAVSRMDSSAVVVSDSIMVGGGQNGDVLSSCEFYRPELDEWQAGPSMMSPRYGHQYLLVNL